MRSFIYHSVCCATALLCGCTPLPTKTTTPVLTSVAHNVAITTKAGQTKTLVVDVPSDVCSAPDYISGFRSQYIYTWNVELGGKEAASASADVRKHLDALRLSPTSTAPIPSQTETPQQAACAALALAKGQTAGGNRAHNDLLAETVGQ
jgi:hypothetical protein